MPGNIWFKWASVIKPSPDSSSFVKTFSSFSTYSASKSTKTLGSNDCIEPMLCSIRNSELRGQTRESIWKLSNVLSLNPLQLQDHYIIRRTNPVTQVAPLLKVCLFCRAAINSVVLFLSVVVTYSCMCHIYCLSIPGTGSIVHRLLLQTFYDLMLSITLSCIKSVLSFWCGTKACCPYTHILDKWPDNSL